MLEWTCLETHIPRNGHTLCRQNATITHFVKFVTSSVREFCSPPSKTADSKVVSVTRAEVMLCVSEPIVEQNIPLALAMAVKGLGPCLVARSRVCFPIAALHRL